MTLKEKIQFVENWINENSMNENSCTARYIWGRTLHCTCDEDYESLYKYIINYCK